MKKVLCVLVALILIAACVFLYMYKKGPDFLKRASSNTDEIVQNEVSISADPTVGTPIIAEPVVTEPTTLETKPVVVEVVTEPETEPETEPVTEPIATEPEFIPVATEPVVEQSTEPTTEPATEPTNEAPNAKDEIDVNNIDESQITVLYALKGVNVRSGPSLDSEVLGTLSKDQRVEKIVSNDNPWVKIRYNGQVAYVWHEYLTMAKPPRIYEVVDEIVYAGHDVNIRSHPSTAAKLVGKLKEGESIQRIGIGSNNWSRVLYNGEECYIFSEYLSTDKNFHIPVENFTSETIPEETKAPDSEEATKNK